MEIIDLVQLMDKFVRSKGWYDLASPRPQTARNLAISLNLEAAEVLEHFQWGDQGKKQAVLDKLEVNQHRKWD
jgi:8-oxo-dGTP diphosphatase